MLFMKYISTFLIVFFVIIVHSFAQPGGYTYTTKIGIPIISTGGKIKISPDNKSIYIMGSTLVQKIDLTGVVLQQWGGPGSGNGNFKNLIDIAVDYKSNVYVLDAGNQLIQKFDANGNFLLQWTSTSAALAMYFANGSIYVLEPTDIIKYSTTGTTIKTVPVSFLSEPSHFCVDTVENFYASQTYQVSMYNSIGVHQQDFGYWTFSGPGNIDIDSSYYLYVEDNFNAKVNVYTPTSINFINSIVASNSATVPNQTISFTIDASKNVYLSDYNGFEKFTSTGVFLSTFSYRDFVGNGHILRPLNIAIDSKSNIYVADANNLIQKFSPSGVFIQQWGGTGSTTTTFNSIGSISIDANDLVIVTDQLNELVKQFDTNGNFINQYSGYNPGKVGVFSGLTELAIDTNNFQYVLNNGSILKYNSQGYCSRYWGSNGYNPGQFTNPSHVVVSKNNFVYVLDLNYISKFDTAGTFKSRFRINGLSTITPFNSNQLYAVDGSGNTILYDTSGTFLNSWPMQSGAGLGKFLSIHKIVVDKNGNLFIVDPTNNCIQIFTTGITTTSVFNQVSQDKQLSIYPNPSDGSFTIAFSEPIKSTRIINMVGEYEVFYSNEIKTSLRGLLIVESITSDGAFYRSKIIVD